MTAGNRTMRASSSVGLGLAVVVAVSASASAQPVTSPATCAVTIARAPEDVRVVVEAWVRAEPHCSTALEVRIIPTDGGLYILAQDEHGRIRERIVPDPQSAGVLIASWVADDTIYVPPPTATPGRDVAPGASPSAEVGTEQFSPPDEPITPTMPPPPRYLSKWVGLGLLLEPENQGGGLRADADLFTHDHYSFGAAISASAHTIPAVSFWGDGKLMTNDVKLMATAAHTWQAGRWFLRGAFGFGAVHTRAFATIYNMNYPYSFVHASGWFPTGELVTSAGVELGKNWAFSIGPAITMYSQEFKADPEPSQSNYMPTSIARRSLEIMVLTGFKYRL